MSGSPKPHRPAWDAFRDTAGERPVEILPLGKIVEVKAEKGKQPNWATTLDRARAKSVGEYRDEFNVGDSEAVSVIDGYLSLDESAKAADPVVALPFVSSSGVIDKIEHVKELIENGGWIRCRSPRGKAMDHAITKLDEVVEMLPAWLFVPPG